MYISKALLNYMYQEGYTEEDMYDAKTIRKAAKAFFVDRVRNGFEKVWEAVKRVARDLWEMIKPVAVYFEELKERNQLQHSTSSKFRPAAIRNMNHQVLDRKPRHFAGSGRDSI